MALVVRHFDTLEQLCSESARWNDLWQRSTSVRSTARVEHLALFKESFASTNAFCALVIEDGGHWVLGVPLLRTRRWGISRYATPGNAWTPCGEMLLDSRQTDCATLLHMLFEELVRRKRGWIEWDGLNADSALGKTLLSALDKQGLNVRQRLRFETALTKISGSWDGYLATRSRNQRRQLRLLQRHCQEDRSLEVALLDHLPSESLATLLDECWALEARGWKGRNATAVQNHGNVKHFYEEQARLLSDCGELALATLRQAGRLIAFEYGWQARGVRGILKIGYDESQARISPGQILRARLLESLFSEAEVNWVDYVGPMNQATSVWATHTYHVGRVATSVGSATADAALHAVQCLEQMLRRKRPFGCESRIPGADELSCCQTETAGFEHAVPLAKSSNSQPTT